MDVVYTIFDWMVGLFTEFFNTAMTGWGIFGTWLIFCILLRKLAQAFNKTKG